MTKIVNDYPPNFAAIKAKFNPPRSIIYAYEGVIYVPSGHKVLPWHLVAHEEVHFKQQKAVGGAEEWWRLYIEDPRFRLEQEVEAYRAQWRAIVDAGLGRAGRREILAKITNDLSSRLYGNLMTKDQARRMVTQP